MWDSWEDTFLFDKNLSTDAVLDFDKDGFSNLEEYISGTELSWSAVSGRTYSVLESDTPGGSFVEIHSVVAGADGVLKYTPAAGLGPQLLSCR